MALRSLVHRLLLSAALLLALCSRSFAAVLINEFVYDPPGSDTGNEWVELYNTEESTVSLGGWALQTDDNRFPGSTKAYLCGTIAPHGFYLIKEDSATISTATLADVISGTLAMGNAGSKADGIQLLDSGGEIRDRIVYGSPDSDGLCEGICSTAPRSANGASVCRSTPGASGFVTVSASSVSPTGSGGPGCRYHPCPAGSGRAAAVFSEVAPSAANGDFIELYATGQSDLCGVRILEGDSVVKTFPSVTPRPGSFVLIHASRSSADFPEETDASGDLNGDGVTDLSSDESSPGLTGSVNDNLTLRNADGSVADFLSWATSSDGTYDASQQSRYDQAVAAGVWSPSGSAGDDASYEAGSVRWNNDPDRSLTRRSVSDGSLAFAKPARAQDWSVDVPTPGSGIGAALSAAGPALEVRQSPFSPYGDGGHDRALIVVRAPAGSFATVQIFDASGRWVATLADRSAVPASGLETVAWDGRDAAGRTVSVGIYVAHLEVQRPGGGAGRENRTVVVGRRL